MMGFSAGCGVLLVRGIWGIVGRMLEIWGGGVGCWLTAVALRSSAIVSEFSICGYGWDAGWVGGVDAGGAGAGTEELGAWIGAACGILNEES
jgi:hypothetical protein